VVRKGEPTVVNELRRDGRHYDKRDDETQFVTRAILAMPESPLIVIGDETRLKQVLLNLASNGAKCDRDDGRLDLTVERAGDGVSVSIRDTGVGIPEESLDRLFQRFCRVPGTENVGRPSGLGLDIAKSLVEPHGADINVDSGVGEETTLATTLPLGIAD